MAGVKAFRDPTRTQVRFINQIGKVTRTGEIVRIDPNDTQGLPFRVLDHKTLLVDWYKAEDFEVII